MSCIENYSHQYSLTINGLDRITGRVTITQPWDVELCRGEIDTTFVKLLNQRHEKIQAKITPIYV